MDWDDLKILLALSRKGSARGAAQALGVSNSTVTRRLDEMERVLGTQLFDRTPDGYRMTVAAEAFLPTAEHVEELVLSAERKITGGDQELEGAIRLTLPPTSGLHFLVEALSAFSQQYPLIELELMASNDALDLSRREADIAIRVMPQGVKPPEYLIGRYLSPISASTYVHRSMLNPNQPDDTSHLAWIGKNLGDQVEPWLSETDVPPRPVRHAIDNLALLYEAVNCKMGMAYMPCFTAYGQPDVIRIPGARINHHADMWVLTHKDLRLSARMRVLREVIARAFAGISHQLDSRPAE
ncbi:MAG: DNA-binding transcriptional LysR family regulator [Alcanivorax sp.]